MTCHAAFVAPHMEMVFLIPHAYAARREMARRECEGRDATGLFCSVNADVPRQANTCERWGPQRITRGMDGVITGAVGIGRG